MPERYRLVVNEGMVKFFAIIMNLIAADLFIYAGKTSIDKGGDPIIAASIAAFSMLIFGIVNSLCLFETLSKIQEVRGYA